MTDSAQIVPVDERRCRLCPSGHTGLRHDAETAFDALTPEQQEALRNPKPSPEAQAKLDANLERMAQQRRSAEANLGPLGLT